VRIWVWLALLATIGSVSSFECLFVREVSR
jgi:hypothetical protein